LRKKTDKVAEKKAQKLTLKIRVGTGFKAEGRWDAEVQDTSSVTMGQRA